MPGENEQDRQRDLQSLAYLEQLEMHGRAPRSVVELRIAVASCYYITV